MTDQKPRIVVVTGATRGIGRSLSKSLAELGHTVFGCGRSRSGVEEMNAALGDPHLFDVVDVSGWAEVERWAVAVLSKSPPPDLLVNNAGVINRNARFWEVSAEEFARFLNTNVDGTANVIRAFLPAMITNKRGVVVNMSSGWGRSTSPEVSHRTVPASGRSKD